MLYEVDENDYEALGHSVVELLNLKVEKDGKIITAYGPKTTLGLGETLFEMVGDYWIKNR